MVTFIHFRRILVLYIIILRVNIEMIENTQILKTDEGDSVELCCLWGGILNDSSRLNLSWGARMASENRTVRALLNLVLV